MTYTPIIQETYYVVEMVDFLVEKTSLDVSLPAMNGNHSIVDSGTTLLVLNEPLFDAFVNYVKANYCPSFPPQLRQLCSLNSQNVDIFSPGVCWTITIDEVMLFPTINIKLQNTTVLPLGPEYYFLEILNSDGSPTYCFGIAPGTGGLGTILGDVFMQAYNVYFDRANAMIGFAPVQNCSGAAADLQIVSGDGQSGAVDSHLDDNLQVKALYNDLIAATGLIVEFAVLSGDAEFSNARVVADDKGIASTSVTLKSVGNVKISATLYGTNTAVIFNLTGKALSTVSIILIVVGALVFIGIIVTIAIVIRRRRHHHHGRNYEHKTGLLQDYQ